MFKTPQDLSTFLKMQGNTFHVQSSLVTLVQRSTPSAATTTATTTTTGRPLHDIKEMDHCNNNENLSNESALNINNNINLTTGGKQTPKIMSLRQRINSLVMKTLADNTERDRIAASATNHTNTTAPQG
jgi:exonuclease 3'-5' domain-containing protein 1